MGIRLCSVFLQFRIVNNDYSDRVLRKSAFDTLYETYLKQKNTIAATYNASVKKDIFYANVRKY